MRNSGTSRPEPADEDPGLTRRRGLVAGSVLLGWLAMAGPSARAEEHQVVIGGSGSMVGGMRVLSQAFAARHGAPPAIRVLPAMGSRGGMRALTEKRVDMALSNFQPGARLGDGLRVISVEYARSPFVLAVRAGSSPGPLTSEQVAALYQPGASLTAGLRARPVLRPGDDVDNELIAAMGPAIARALQEAAGRPGMLTAATDSDAADMIEQTPGAFGAVTLAQILTEERKLEPLQIDGRTASIEAIRSGAYGHYKRFFAVVREPATSSVARFLNFLGTPEGRNALAKSGQLPLL
jgi:phosphate transport system substrate-binding protein